MADVVAAVAAADAACVPWSPSCYRFHHSAVAAAAVVVDADDAEEDRDGKVTNTGAYQN